LLPFWGTLEGILTHCVLIRKGYDSDSSDSSYHKEGGFFPLVCGTSLLFEAMRGIASMILKLTFK
jgi:hypothetical protein